MVRIKRVLLLFLCVLFFSSIDVFSLSVDSSIELKPVENCTAGSSQFRPDPKDDCKTQERKCCGSGLLNSWSEWGKECSEGSNCGLNQCWDGSKCVDKPSSGACTCTNGTCKITYTCSSGKGWQKKQECTCKSGYQKSTYTGECVHSSCLQTCSNGSYIRQKYNNSEECVCCRASCNLYHNGVGQFITGACDCTALLSQGGFPTCCQHQYVGYIYTLPSTFSSCEQFGKAAFNENGWGRVSCPSKIS